METDRDKETKDGAPDTVKGRLLRFLKSRRITQSDFCRGLGVSPTYVASMRKSLAPDKVMRICEMYPELNRDWLLYGIGEMENPGEPDEALVSPERNLVPLLPVEAYAGRLNMWSEGVSLRGCDKIVSPVADADFAIDVCGDSMEPEFKDGSRLLIKRINEKAFIPWGNPMVIDTENGVLVKALYPCRRSGDFIEARSYNPDYPPIDIPTDSIYGIYRILCSINMRGTM